MAVMQNMLCTRFFHLAHLLLFMSSVVPLQSQPIMKQETLTPGNTNANGASIMNHPSEVSIVSNLWNVEIQSQNSWQFIIILDNSWGFDPVSFSRIQLTVHSPTTTSFTDKLLFGFTPATAIDQYFSLSVPIGGGSTNQIFPNCDTSTNPTQTYGVGEIASLPDFDRSCDIAGGACANWHNMLPLTNHSNQFPLTITLDNSPSTNAMSVRADTTSTSHIQTCGFVSFPTDRGLKIYVAGNDPRQTFQISSFDIEAYAESLAPTNAPTTAAPTTLSPTQLPSVSPTNDPSFAPSNAPTDAPTVSPSNAPTTAPSNAPTKPPTNSPINAPSFSPTNAPSFTPTNTPSAAPTATPTKAPTLSPIIAPTNAPTETPTAAPTELPTSAPSSAPTEHPTPAPTGDPTKHPTREPTTDPTDDPTHDPTMIPTNYPSKEPTTHQPTVQPTIDPTRDPTTNPTMYPTMDPTVHPPTLSPSLPLAMEASDDSIVGTIVVIVACSAVVLVLLKIGCRSYYKKKYAKPPKKYSEGGAMHDPIQLQGTPVVEMEGAPINSYIVTVCFIGKIFHYQLPSDTGADNQWDDSVYNKLIHVVANEFNLNRRFALFEQGDGVKITVDDIDDIITAFESCGKKQIVLYVEVNLNKPSMSARIPGRATRVASNSGYRTTGAKLTASLNLDIDAPTSSSDDSDSSEDMIMRKTRQ